MLSGPSKIPLPQGRGLGSSIVSGSNGTDSTPSCIPRSNFGQSTAGSRSNLKTAIKSPTRIPSLNTTSTPPIHTQSAEASTPKRNYNLNSHASNLQSPQKTAVIDPHFESIDSDFSSSKTYNITATTTPTSLSPKSPTASGIPIISSSINKSTIQNSETSVITSPSRIPVRNGSPKRRQSSPSKIPLLSTGSTTSLSKIPKVGGSNQESTFNHRKNSSSISSSPVKSREITSGHSHVDEDVFITAQNSVEELDACDTIVSPSKTTNYRDQRDALNLELSSTSPSKIPTPKSSTSASELPATPSSTSSSASRSRIPTVGWSLSRSNGGSSETSPSHNPPFIPIRDKCSNTSSSSSSNDVSVASKDENHQQYPVRKMKKKKSYEAFVMTGDRMISLAKTPANSDFKSHYSSTALETSTSMPTSPSFQGPSTTSEINEEESNRDNQVSNNVTLRDPPLRARRTLVRTSKSEDQLMNGASSNIPGGNGPLSPDYYDDCTSSSVHTLLDTRTSEEQCQEPTDILPTSQTSLINQQPKINNTPVSDKMKTSLTELASPDEFSTSSLISVSEHYNGESLLEDNNMVSPLASSSPETPDWSLIDSFHKSNNNNNNNSSTSNLKKHNEGNVITCSDNNKVVITIGKNESQSQEGTGLAPLAAITSPVSSDGTITPEYSSVTPTISPTNDETPPGVNKKNEENIYSEPFDTTTPISPPPPSISNNESSEGESDLESLHSYHPPAKIIDLPSAIRLAKRLYQLDGFRKSDVSRHLSKNNDYNQVVAQEYLKFFDFTALTLDGALRNFLNRFCLTGETQERERVLFHFSKRFMECNPECSPSMFQSSDAVHTLTCAIMLLNTDLHGENLQRKMTANEFIENLSDLNEGQNFPRDLLKNLYYNIKHEPIPWALNEDHHPLSASGNGFSHSGDEHALDDVIKDINVLPSNGASSKTLGAPVHYNNHNNSDINSKPINLGSGVNPFLALPDPMSSTDYKKGYVMRKSCVESNGKKTKMGKRSWKMFFLSLRDMVLYCFKDEKSLRAPGAFEDLNNAIRIHHGLAVRATDYTKKQFVFRLYTSDQAEYLFQTSDEKELLTWIDAINYVVASFSSPKLPAPCSSSINRFQRPLLPSSKSKLNPTDQLEQHEKSLMELRTEIEQHLQHPPAKVSKSAVLSAYSEKQQYLKLEILRYETYILTLRTKNANNTAQDLPPTSAPGPPIIAVSSVTERRIY